MLHGCRDTQAPFPLSLAIPAGPGSTVLGLGLFIAVITMLHWSAGDRPTVILIASTVTVAVMSFHLGQRNVRYFLELLLWLLIAATIFHAPLRERTTRWISGVVSAHAVLALFMIAIGITRLTLGALTLGPREKTMDSHAYERAVMKWADSLLPPGVSNNDMPAGRKLVKAQMAIVLVHCLIRRQANKCFNI